MCVGTTKINLFPNVFNDTQNKWNTELRNPLRVCISTKRYFKRHKFILHFLKHKCK